MLYDKYVVFQFPRGLTETEQKLRDLANKVTFNSLED